MIFNAEKCLEFIQNKLKINLYDYQKEMVIAFANNKTVSCGRCIGRSFVADAISKYIKYELSIPKYDSNSDLILSSEVAIGHLISNDNIHSAKHYLSKEEFEKEYYCR